MHFHLDYAFEFCVFYSRLHALTFHLTITVQHIYIYNIYIYIYISKLCYTIYAGYTSVGMLI